MRGPACLLAVLAFAAAAQVAAAGDRFIPEDPAFVVASIRQVMPDESLRALVDAWRSDPGAEEPVVALATALLDRAHSLREPSYVGRAEAVLAPVVSQGKAGSASRRLYAETLQYRHDFVAAEALLDSILDESPRDSAARTQRASIRLVRGNFTAARGDCAQLMASGGPDTAIGIACLAESYAGSGQLEQAIALLERYPSTAQTADAPSQAYLLTVRGELRERAHDLGGAITDYRAALSLNARDDSIRAALADALAAHGEPDAASELLTIERPSLALLVRLSLVAGGPEREELARRAGDWLALETARGDSAHNREAAMLYLGLGDPARALSAARQNFVLQKELPDVRILARASVAARDLDAQRHLREWMRSTGFADAVAESIL